MIKQLDRILNCTCGYKKRRRWYYFLTENANPLWLEARVNMRPDGNLLAPPPDQQRKDGLASLNSNCLRPTVVWEHKWRGKYIKSYRTVHLLQVSYSTHLLNFNDESYDWAINLMSSSPPPKMARDKRQM